MGFRISPHAGANTAPFGSHGGTRRQNKKTQRGSARAERSRFAGTRDKCPKPGWRKRQMDQSLNSPPWRVSYLRCHSFSSSGFTEQGDALPGVPVPSAGPVAEGHAGTGATGQQLYPQAAAFASPPVSGDAAGDLRSANQALHPPASSSHMPPRANRLMLLGPKSPLQNGQLIPLSLPGRL